MNTTQVLKQAIEETAARTGYEPSTVGRMAGQGGKFYERLCEGKRVWPETAEAVLEKLAHMTSPLASSPEGHLACNSQKSGAKPARVQDTAGCDTKADG